MGLRRGKYNGEGWKANYHRSATSNRNYDKTYAKFRKEVRKRDKNICQMPDCKSRKTLQVHHIIPWAESAHLRYEVTNGITLCRKCHDLIRGKEYLYIELFTRIIERKNNQ